MAITSEITKNECVKEMYPHSKAKIRFVQHCAAILAIPELLLCMVTKLDEDVSVLMLRSTGEGEEWTNI